MGDLAMLPAVYLDFNVLVFVLDGLQPALRSELESARDAGRIHVPFSIEHIVEVTRGYDELAESVRLRVDRMVRDMGELSRSRFVTLDQHTGALRIEARNPVEVWETAFVRLSDFGVDDPEVERALHDALRGGAQAVEMHRALLSRIALDGIPTADLAAGLEDLFKVGRSFFLDARDLQERLDEALARA
ncbi:MAG: hypothetical protein KC656_20860, partial [Myxococcales bacterium]|nr:hypothetical protein [Myxococcales bacterium]